MKRPNGSARNRATSLWCSRDPIGAVAASLLLLAQLPSAVATSETVITVDASSVVEPISRLILGASETWPLGMHGALNMNTGEVAPSFGTAFRDLGLTTIRHPGGTVGNYFNWKSAIGPVSARATQLNSNIDGQPFDSAFGPDEYGRFWRSTICRATSWSRLPAERCKRPPTGSNT